MRRPCFSRPGAGGKVIGGKAQGVGGFPCPGHLEGPRELWPLDGCPAGWPWDEQVRSIMHQLILANEREEWTPIS